MSQRTQKRRIRPTGPPKTQAPHLVPGFLLGPYTAPILASLFLVIMAFVAFARHLIGDYGVETDFYWAYAPHARQILHGVVVIDPYKGPGYEIILAIVGAITGDFFKAGLLISLVSAATVLLVSYNLIARLYSRETAFLVCLGLAFNHIFLLCSYTASTDMFFNLVALLALSLLLRSDDLRLWEIAGAGALTGFAYITRYNGLSFYLAVAVGLLFLNIKEVAWKKRILAFGVFLAGSLLFAGPWGIYTWLEAGRPFANNNHLNIAYEMFGKGKMSWDEYSFKFSTQFHSYLDVFAYNPGVFITQLATNAYEHFWNDLRLLIGLPIGVFTLAGIVAVFSQKSTRKQVMYFVYGIAFYLILLPVFYGERFSLYLAPTLILLAVLFFQWRKIPTIGFPGFGLAHVVLYGVLLYSSIGAIQKLSDEIGSGPAEILQIRDAFRERFPAPAPGTTIVARKPQIAYYLDMTFVPFPYVESIDSLLAECRKARAQYLYYSVIEAGMRPQFRYLLDPRRAPPSLRAVVQTTYPPSVLYFIDPR